MEDQLKAGAVRIAAGVRDVAPLRAASRDPATGGRSRLSAASYGGRLADPVRLPGSGPRPGCCWAPRDPLAGTVTIARSAASSIRSRRSISSPRYRTSDASSAALPGPDPGEERGQAAQGRAAPAHRRPRGHLGIPRHLSARTGPSGQAGPVGSATSLRRVPIKPGEWSQTEPSQPGVPGRPAEQPPRLVRRPGPRPARRSSTRCAAESGSSARRHTCPPAATAPPARNTAAALAIRQCQRTALACIPPTPQQLRTTDQRVPCAALPPAGCQRAGPAVTHPAALRRFAGSQMSASRQAQCRPGD
jgi:hypothetical protein